MEHHAQRGDNTSERWVQFAREWLATEVPPERRTAEERRLAAEWEQRAEKLRRADFSED